jgi:hypothetical protein
MLPTKEPSTSAATIYDIRVLALSPPVPFIGGLECSWCIACLGWSANAPGLREVEKTYQRRVACVEAVFTGIRQFIWPRLDRGFWIMAREYRDERDGAGGDEEHGGEEEREKGT